jgi:hypothetical protein
VQIGLNPDDPVPSALAVLHDWPEQFGNYFDDLGERERGLVLQDPEIARWHETR